MTRAGNIGAWAGLACLLALTLTGCFESNEEKADRAYANYDFETAHVLARELVAEGNPHGYELLALMAAQGLGRPIDYGEAFELAEKAEALDPAYARARKAIAEHIDAKVTAAQAAFDAEDFERAYALTEPLARHGHPDGLALRKALVVGHYVLLPGSDMSWLEFWNTCSGNTRFVTNEQSHQAFAEQCVDRHAVWDGTVIRVGGGQADIKMQPGRPGPRHDLTLKLAGEAPKELTAPGGKVRFGGVIAERGTPAKPDILVEARLIEPAPMNGEEARAAETDKSGR